MVRQFEQTVSDGAGRLLSHGQTIRRAQSRANWHELEDFGVLVRAAGVRRLRKNVGGIQE